MEVIEVAELDDAGRHRALAVQQAADLASYPDLPPTTPEEFARLYNLAQAVSAPVLAAAVNSPLLLDRRLTVISYHLISTGVAQAQSARPQWHSSNRSRW